MNNLLMFMKQTLKKLMSVKKPYEQNLKICKKKDKSQFSEFFLFFFLLFDLVFKA